MNVKGGNEGSGDCCPVLPVTKEVSETWDVSTKTGKGLSKSGRVDHPKGEFGIS